MPDYDLSEVHKMTSEQEPIASIFFNRSIDWEDNDVNEIRSIFDITIFTIGLVFNFVILVTILTKPRMHTSIGCYVLSLTVSNFVILLNVFDDVLHRWFAVNFKLDIDFVGRVTLQSSAMTLVIFSLDRYITICRSGSDWHKNTQRLSTAIKGILVIWSYASIATAMELNLYEHFRTRTIINIFCWSTAMYVLLPTIIMIFLGVFIIIEFAENRDLIILKKTENDLENLRLLAGLTINFYVTMVPQRIVTILYYEKPQTCCSPLTMNICYYLTKVSSIIGPIIYIGTLKSLRRSVQEISSCRW